MKPPEFEDRPAIGPAWIALASSDRVPERDPAAVLAARAYVGFTLCIWPLLFFLNRRYFDALGSFAWLAFCHEPFFGIFGAALAFGYGRLGWLAWRRGDLSLAFWFLGVTVAILFSPLGLVIAMLL